MASSHMEDVSEQDRGRDHGPPTQGRNDKSCDAISSFEGQIAKLELGVADTKGDIDLLEQRIKEAMGGFVGVDQGTSRGDARLIDSRGVTRGVYGFSRQGLECAH